MPRLSLEYHDFGFGAPPNITLTNDTGKAHLAPGSDNKHGPISLAGGGDF